MSKDQEIDAVILTNAMGYADGAQLENAIEEAGVINEENPLDDFFVKQAVLNSLSNHDLVMCITQSLRSEGIINE